jgi:hypothetical protein
LSKIEEILKEMNLTVEPSPAELVAKGNDEEVFRVAEEFLQKIQPIIDTRNKIRKSSDDLVNVLGLVADKLDDLIALKNVNAMQEAEVLELLKRELLAP